MNRTDQQIIKLITILKSRGIIRFDAEFCREIGLLHQDLIKIKKGLRHFTLSHVHDVARIYDVNLYWLFGISDKIFMNEPLTKKLID